MDDFDLKLLHAVQMNARSTSEELAQEVGLSASACQRRLAKLRQSGAIDREVAIIDPKHAGGALTMIVQASMAHGRGDIVDAFKREAQGLAHIQQCYYVTGAFDFVVIIIVSSMPEYEKIIRKLFHENPNIQRFETSIVMDRVKVGLEMPVMPE